MELWARTLFYDNFRHGSNHDLILNAWLTRNDMAWNAISKYSYPVTNVEIRNINDQPLWKCLLKYIVS